MDHDNHVVVNIPGPPPDDPVVHQEWTSLSKQYFNKEERITSRRQSLVEITGIIIDHVDEDDDENDPDYEKLKDAPPPLVRLDTHPALLLDRTEIVVEDNHAPYSRVVKHASKTASATSSDASPPATLPGDLSTLISITPLAQGEIVTPELPARQYTWNNGRPKSFHEIADESSETNIDEVQPALSPAKSVVDDTTQLLDELTRLHESSMKTLRIMRQRSRGRSDEDIFASADAYKDTSPDTTPTPAPAPAPVPAPQAFSSPLPAQSLETPAPTLQDPVAVAPSSPTLSSSPVGLSDDTKVSPHNKSWSGPVSIASLQPRKLSLPALQKTKMRQSSPLSETTPEEGTPEIIRRVRTSKDRRSIIGSKLYRVAEQEAQQKRRSYGATALDVQDIVISDPEPETGSSDDDDFSFTGTFSPFQSAEPTPRHSRIDASDDLSLPSHNAPLRASASLEALDFTSFASNTPSQYSLDKTLRHRPSTAPIPEEPIEDGRVQYPLADPLLSPHHSFSALNSNQVSSEESLADFEFATPRRFSRERSFSPEHSARTSGGAAELNPVLQPNHRRRNSQTSMTSNTSSQYASAARSLATKSHSKNSLFEAMKETRNILAKHASAKDELLDNSSLWTLVTGRQPEPESPVNTSTKEASHSNQSTPMMVKHHSAVDVNTAHAGTPAAKAVWRQSGSAEVLSSVGAVSGLLPGSPGGARVNRRQTTVAQGSPSPGVSKSSIVRRSKSHGDNINRTRSHNYRSSIILDSTPSIYQTLAALRESERNLHAIHKYGQMFPTPERPRSRATSRAKRPPAKSVSSLTHVENVRPHPMTTASTEPVFHALVSRSSHISLV